MIESTKTEVVYVPTYYPTAVYGAWSYPTYYYPPMYPAYPPGGLLLSFTAGMVWGAAIWGDCNWGGNDVNIDIDRQNNFIDNTDRDGSRKQIENRAGSKQNWNHDPQHRKGAGYKDSKVAQRYGAAPGSSRVTRDQARGYTGAAGKPSAGTRDVGGQRPGTGPAARPQPAQRPSTGAASRPAAKATPSTRTGQNSGSFSGARNPSLDRASSSRGSASRSSAGLRSGGASRGGGGRGGGRR